MLFLDNNLHRHAYVGENSILEHSQSGVELPPTGESHNNVAASNRIQLHKKIIGSKINLDKMPVALY